jgi:large subunit ribosomal protein L35
LGASLTAPGPRERDGAIAQSGVGHYNARTSRPAGHAVAVFYALHNEAGRCSRAVAHNNQESKMPKLKTKSGAKKRFKITGTGKVKAQAQGKRHGMIKRTAMFVRSARGTMVLNDSDAKIVKKYMPYVR